MNCLLIVLVLVVLETTAKRLKIIAQVFSPGFAIIRRCALKALSTPRGGVQFPIGAVLQHSNTPSLRVAGFEDEDDDEDENEAPEGSLAPYVPHSYR